MYYPYHYGMWAHYSSHHWFSLWSSPLFWLALIVIYIYNALAYTAIAKKLDMEKPWLMWIPIVNIYMISKMAKMHWWPMLLMIGFFIPILNIFCSIAFVIFAMVWIWKVFQRVGRPGWWVLFTLIPIIGYLIFAVLLGIAAWSNRPTSNQKMPPVMPIQTK